MVDDSDKTKKKNTKKRIRNWIISILIVTLGTYLLICLLFILFQGKYIYHPSSHIESTPNSIGLEYEDITLSTSDGIELDSWYIPASNDSMVVLLCHGNGGNIGDRMESIKIFHNMNLSVFIFDYRGYGKSEGNPNEKGTYIDAETAWDYLIDERNISSDNIIVFGRSLGGAIASKLAIDKDPYAVILESTYTSISDQAKDLLPIFPFNVITRYKYPTIDHVKKISSPILIVHSSDDEMISVNHGKDLFKSANEPKMFLEISGNHNNGFITSGDIYTDGVQSFIFDFAKNSSD